MMTLEPNVQEARKELSGKLAGRFVKVALILA